MTGTLVHTIEVRHRDGVVPCHVSGDEGAPGVLLLAGGDSASRDYYPRVREALAGYRVVGVDRPGTGGATGFRRTDLSYSCRVVAEVLDQVVRGPVVVVGHSFGGMAAVQLAVEAPERVRSLLLLDPTSFNDPLVMQTSRAVVVAAAALARLPGMAKRLTSRHNTMWRKSLGNLDEEAERSFNVVSGDVDLRGDISAIRHSTSDARRLAASLGSVRLHTVIVGADRPTSSRIARSITRLAEELNAELRCWPGTVHALQFQRPDEVVATIQELLELPGAGAGAESPASKRKPHG